jgi:hypothetical protein
MFYIMGYKGGEREFGKSDYLNEKLNSGFGPNARVNSI